MIGKLATRDSGTGRQFKPPVHQSRGRGQNKGNYDMQLWSTMLPEQI